MRREGVSEGDRVGGGDGGRARGREGGTRTSHGLSSSLRLLCVHHHNFDDRIYGDEVRGGS